MTIAIYIYLHGDHLVKLPLLVLSGTTTNSVKDKVVDSINYFDLLLACKKINPSMFFTDKT